MWQFLRRLNIELSYNWAILFLREMKTYDQTTTCTWKLILFINKKKWKQFKCQLVNEWISRMYVHTLEYFSVIKRYEVLIPATTWTKLENTVLKKRKLPRKSIVLKERIQTQKVTYCMIPFTWKVQSRQIHRDRKQIGSFQELGKKGKWRWSSNEYEISFLSIEMFSD